VSGIHVNLLDYSGKDNKLSFERWFNYCVNELKTFGFQNKEQSVLLMERQLRKNARQIYNSYCDTNEERISTPNDNMDIDVNAIETKNMEYKIDINLVSVDQGRKSFWLTIKETGKNHKISLNTAHPLTKSFLDIARMC
ncbi:hypothetical protein BB561_006157, partial [Smittium simulii]